MKIVQELEQGDLELPFGEVVEKKERLDSLAEHSGNDRPNQSSAIVDRYDSSESSTVAVAAALREEERFEVSSALEVRPPLREESETYIDSHDSEVVRRRVDSRHDSLVEAEEVETPQKER